MKLKDRVAIVTGGNKGLGRAISMMLAEEGARVVVAARSKERNKDTVNKITSKGCEAISVALDVAQPASVQAMVDTVLSHWGQVDILVNNAAIFGRMEWIVKYDPDEWDQIMAINLKGPFLCTKAVLPGMMQRRKGVVLNIAAGVVDERVDLGVAAYYASKAGLVNFTRQLAAEVKRYGIRANAIDPGGLKTEMSEDIMKAEEHSDEGSPALVEAQKVEPELRLRTPEEIMPMVRFLVSDDSHMMTGRFLQVSSRGNPLYLQL